MVKPAYLKNPGLLGLLLVCLLLALTFAYPNVTLERDNYRYLFVFDITQSMNVEDVGQPMIDRLSFAKQQLITALNELPCDSEAGLALFTGHRAFLLFTPVALCAHYDELVAMLNKVDWRMAWKARSEVAKGLYKSIALAEKLTAENAVAIDNDLRVIFFSDGHEAPPVHTEYRPRFRGEQGTIRGLIVGVGGLIPKPIPKLDIEDTLLGYWQADEVMQVDTYSLGRQRGANTVNEQMVGVDSSNVAERIRQGTEHLSALREEYLQQLAEETGLAYFRLTNGADLVAQLLAAELATQRSQVTDLRSVLALFALLALLFVYGQGIVARWLPAAGNS